MDFIIHLLINAGVLLVLASIIPGVTVKNYGTAILVCLVIGLLNATIGFFIRFPLNVITLFLITFLVRLFVTVIIIKLTDKLFKGFEVRTWTAAWIVAICLALAAGVVDTIF